MQQRFLLRILCLVFACVSTARAQTEMPGAAGLKVDLSRSTQRSDTAAPHFTEWQFDPASPARIFGNVGVLLRRAGAAGSQLDAGWYKFAIDYSALLALDGVQVKDVASGNGAIEIVLSGLAAGHHAFAAYHNSVSANTPSAISVAVNGTMQIASVTPSVQVTNDYDIPTSHVEFDAVAGRDVVIAYTALGKGSPASANTPIINGFELDTPDPAKRAKKPVPANDNEHVDGDSGPVVLRWTAAPGAVSHDFYLGTDAAAVSAAIHASPEFRENKTTAHSTADKLDSFSTYWWRVDEVDEGFSSRSAKNITFQRNIISEALQHSYHYAAADRSKYETHAFAASISGGIASYHHNLIAHCTDRNWSLAGGLTQGGKYAGQVDIRNNVVYNWRARTTDGGVKQCNFVGN